MHLRALLVRCAHSCLSSSEHTSACAMQYNREGSSAVFLYHIGRCKGTVAGGAPAWTFVFTVRANGGGLWRLPVRQSAARMQLPLTRHTHLQCCFEGCWRGIKGCSTRPRRCHRQVVAGGRHDFGRGGRLLVCDGTGFHEVLARGEVHRLELPKSGAAP